jgi:hypothetical protein
MMLDIIIRKNSQFFWYTISLPSLYKGDLEMIIQQIKNKIVKYITKLRALTI